MLVRVFRMFRSMPSWLPAALVASAAAAGCRLSDPAGLPPRTALDDYIDNHDPAYSWKLVKTIPGEGFTAFVLDMTSQTWRDPSEVDRTVWRHWLTVVRPDRVETDTALLFIGGGRNGGEPPDEVSSRLAYLATTGHTVVAGLGMVPNQPLAFSDDGRPRFEDDLVAHTWNKYMETGDPTWPARMPMVKSAVRAMDTVEAFLAGRSDYPLEIRDFVVAGGSKRGWTTWLTGAVDDRVIAIIPIVIDVLNVIPSMEHHYAAYGFWAPAIGDYVRNGITEKRNAPEYRELIRLVDPFEYRHRLTMPKYIVNSAGDQFFLPDSSRFYFDELLGEKHLRYVPNTDHGLEGSDAIQSIEAYYRAVVTGSPLPRFTWEPKADGSIAVRAAERPLEARLWQASNAEARDFRLETIGKAWTSTVLQGAEDGGDTVYVGRVPAPERGWTAFFIELAWAGSGPNPLKFTTEVRVVPDKLPFAGKLDAEDRAEALPPAGG